MREIKFRGKLVDPDNGKWVYGDLAHAGTKHSPCIRISGNPFMYGVKPETVGQYTGLKDYTEKEIYEGDIIHGDDNGTKYGDGRGVVEWDEDEAAYVVRGPRVNANLSEYVYDDIYVIGNKYDTPEILGGTGK